MLDGSEMLETGADKVKYVGCKGGSIVYVVLDGGNVRMKSVAWSGKCESDAALKLDSR